MIFVEYSLYLPYYTYLIVSNITHLIDSWRSDGWCNVLVVSRLGCFAIDCFGAAAAFHRILLDCSGISAMVVSAQRLFNGSKNNQKSCRCEWCRIIRANVTGIWIEITDTQWKCTQYHMLWYVLWLNTFVGVFHSIGIRQTQGSWKRICW